MLNQFVNDAIDTEVKTETQEIRINPIPCSPPPAGAPPFQCYKVSLEVTGQWIITDADAEDKDESAGITLYLWADGQSDTKRFTHKKGVSRPVDIPIRKDDPFKVEVSPIVTNSPFLVYAKVTETVSTDGPTEFLFFGGDSASVVRIDSIAIVIETITCTEDPSQTAAGDHSSGVQRESLGEEDVRRVEGIHNHNAANLAEAGIHNLRALSEVDVTTVRVSEVSPRRLLDWKAMADILVTFPTLVGNDAQILVEGLGAKGAVDAKELLYPATVNDLKSAMTRVELPADYDLNRLIKITSDE